jgi:hypothetical protein
VKIRGTCLNCGRDFLSQQVLESGGHCWHCGKPYQPHYTATLAEAIEQAERAGSAFEAALEAIDGMEPNLVLDEDSVLAKATAHVRALRERADARAAEIEKAEAASAY